MDNIYLQLVGCQPLIPELAFREPVDWTIREGERWAVVGDNGSGKTVLTNLIAGKFPLKTGSIHYHFLKESDRKVWQSVQILAFDSVYGLADFRNSYYQQRWHSTENDEMPSVGSLLEKYGNNEWLRLFGVDQMAEKKINFLSSGELRKFLITKALMEKPQLLIVENPFIGLDPGSRKTVGALLKDLAAMESIRLILSLSDPNDIPEFVTQVLPVEGMAVRPGMAAREFRRQPMPTLTAEAVKLGESGFSGRDTDGEPIVEINRLSVRYGSKTVLDGLDWTIRRGEK